MKYKLLTILLVLFSLLALPKPGVLGMQQVYSANEQMLASREMSLGNRYANASVNAVFRDNILLNLAYLSGEVKNAKQIDWNQIRKESRYELTLKPGEVFAFHDDVLPMYKGRVAKTTNAHFNAGEGFKSDGWLYGDGVCHFASLINWAARDAKLNVSSPVNHNFAMIPEVPKNYGVSIYATGDSSSIGQMQNLYIENNFDKPVRFLFEYKNDVMKVSVYQ